MLSGYGKREWLTILAIGIMLGGTAVIVGWWWVLIPIVVVEIGLLSFFRDPHRRVPTQRGVVVSPADGVVSSIHRVDHFQAFEGPATCIRIFLSVLNVHVNRSPCHGIVESVTHTAGQHLNALNPASAQANESSMVVLVHPVRRFPIAAVRQVAGLIARTIVCATHEGQILQRGQRYGMIKFGSTTEVYLPDRVKPHVAVQQGQRVAGGITVIANVSPIDHIVEEAEHVVDEPLPRTKQPVAQVTEEVASTTAKPDTPVVD